MSADYDPNSLNHALGRIEANIRMLVEAQHEHRQETQRGFEKIGSRVGKLENFNMALKGKLAALSGIVSLGVAGLSEWLKIKLGK